MRTVFKKKGLCAHNTNEEEEEAEELDKIVVHTDDIQTPKKKKKT